MDLDHADVSLGLVVGEGDAGILKEGENRGLVLLKAEQKVESLGAFWTTATLLGRRRRLRVFTETGFQKSPVFGDPGGVLDGGGRAGAIFLSEDGAVHSEEQAKHPRGPFLMEDVAKENEFAQEMGVAKAVAAGEGEIAAQAVMDEAAGKAGQDVEMAEGVDSAFFVNAIPR